MSRPEIVRELVNGAWVTTVGSSAGGGSQPIAIVTYAFAFDTPNLLTGVPIYTPSPGDLIPAYAWVALSNPADWNGSTPTTHLGYAGALDTYDANLGMANDLSASHDAAVGAHAVQPLVGGSNGQGVLFTDTTPLVFSVDDDNGGDPGSTSGTATLFLQIVLAA